MLTSFSLSNFKAFGPEQRIPLRPITLVFGANSSGKSSIIHSLLLAHHAQDTGDWDITHPKLGGDAVDIGGFASYLHRIGDNTVGPAVSMSFTKTLGVDCDLRSSLLSSLTEARLTLNIDKAKTPSARLSQCLVEVDGMKLFLLTPKPGTQNTGKMSLNLWEASHPLTEKLIASIIQQAAIAEDAAIQRQTVIDEINQHYPTASIEASGFLPRDILFPVGQPESLSSAPIDSLRKLSRRLFAESVQSIFADLHRHFANELKQIEYLGPLRSYPSRQLLDDESSDPNWRSGGGFAWKTLVEDETVREKVSDWLDNPVLKTRYRLRVDRLLHTSAMEKAIPGILSDQLSTLMLAQAEREREKGESIFSETQLHELLRDPGAIANFLEQYAPQLLDDIARNEMEMTTTDPVLIQQEPEYVQGYTLEKARAKVLEDFRHGIIPDWEYSKIVEQFIKNDPTFSTTLREVADADRSAGTCLADLIKSDSATRAELRLMAQPSNTPVTHRDVGIGISQVLPVLVHAYGSKNKLIAIEQPEIHLHPALQAELGDLFIESALGENGNNFILETHSEHLILRLLRRVRETTAGELAKDDVRRLSPSDLCVLYAQPTEQGSTVIELPVTEDGDFGVPWPGGFFAERTRELF